MTRAVPKALTIGGSDSGGCAGIQADLKTFLALGVHGMSVVTAVTAQNTQEVRAVAPVSPRILSAQLHAVFDDMRPGAVKSGMIPTPATASAVAECLRAFALDKYVLDPVMVSTSGARLMRPTTLATMIRTLVPLALIVTPNRAEAEILAKRAVDNPRHAREAARIIHDLGAAYILIKGGHFAGPATDILYDGRDFSTFSSRRVRTRNVHGTGCTLSAAITAYLCHGFDPVTSIAKAKHYMDRALKRSFRVGEGPGPVGHLQRPTADF